MNKSHRRAIIYPKEIEQALIDNPITTKISKQDQVLKRSKLEERRKELLEEAALKIDEASDIELEDGE